MTCVSFLELQEPYNDLLLTTVRRNPWQSNLAGQLDWPTLMGDTVNPHRTKRKSQHLLYRNDIWFTSYSARTVPSEYEVRPGCQKILRPTKRQSGPVADCSYVDAWYTSIRSTLDKEQSPKSRVTTSMGRTIKMPSRFQQFCGWRDLCRQRLITDEL